MVCRTANRSLFGKQSRSSHRFTAVRNVESVPSTAPAVVDTAAVAGRTRQQLSDLETDSGEVTYVGLEPEALGYSVSSCPPAND